MSGYCSDCGNPLAVGAGFCSKCGAVVSQRQQQATSRAEPRVAQSSYYAPLPPSHPSAGPRPYDYRQPYNNGQRPDRDISGLGWVIEPFRRYADFNGRSRRTEYWVHSLLHYIVYTALIVLVIVGMPWGEYESNPNAEPTALAIGALLAIVAWWLVTFLPSLAVAVRRLHDSDKSGWLVLLFIVLGLLLGFIGWIIQAVFMFMDGTRGPNQYGDDPKNQIPGDIFR